MAASQLDSVLDFGCPDLDFGLDLSTAAEIGLAGFWFFELLTDFWLCAFKDALNI